MKMKKIECLTKSLLSSLIGVWGCRQTQIFGAWGQGLNLPIQALFISHRNVFLQGIKVCVTTFFSCKEIKGLSLLWDAKVNGMI